ncbi:MAG: hypothetical protein CMN72_15510 [Sphingomonas sp.]|nr:hypothetical protein [Sphingomonas sp.]
MKPAQREPTTFSRFGTVRDNALLAMCYFVAGYAGISLAVPPGYATIIWPASGIALCALLIRGSRVWPGLWLGSFAFNLVTGFNNLQDHRSVWPIILTAAAIGTGASIQALVSLSIAQKFVDVIELSNARRMMKKALFIIALPCVIAPTIGVASLLAAGAIGPAMLIPNWTTWYLGDFLGILLTIPILLLSPYSPIRVRWRGRSLQGASALVAISLITTLLLTFYAWRFISEREYAQAQDSFVVMAANTEEALQHRVQIYQRALQSAASFVTVNGNPTPAEWQKYVDGVEISRVYPGMRGLGMFQAVTEKNLPAFRQKFESDFSERFEIHPRVEREEHFVLNRIEPMEGNLAALGLDLAFEQGRREAITLSKSMKDPVLTRPVTLVQDADRGPGFLLILPVLNDSGKPSGRWIYAPLVAEELMTALTPRQGDDFALQVYYGDTIGKHALLYASGDAPIKPRFELRRTMMLAGQPISLRWTSLRAFDRRYVSSAPAVTIASGLTITLLLGVLLSIFLRREGVVTREVKRATVELAEQNKMLEMAEATAHIGHWHLNLITDDFHWSDEVFRLHGMPVGDTPDLKDAINFYHPEDRAIVSQSIEAAILDHQPYQFRARLLTQGGVIRHVEVRGRPETDSNGMAVALIGVIIDRTEETLMRERLTETIEEARAADRAKSSFLANMSHEIRTPMNGVIGFTELALTEETVPEQRRRLQLIADSSNAMLRLLNDLLDFAKIEAKQMAVVSEPTDLRHTLRSCQRLMEPVAKSKGLILSLDIDPSVPPRVLIDKMRLRQIVLNLVGNALKFTLVGRVTLSAAIRNDPSSGNRIICITVRDTGIGIPADRVESIFGMFTQADETTARRFGGTGLGLPISAELAKLMGGNLSATSEEGKGSTFALSLPLETVADAGDETAIQLPSEQLIQKTRLRILVAEDNPVNQELTIAMVHKIGHECELVNDGQRAVEAVLEAKRSGNPYDLVLMDMQMPVMDGLQAARAIRATGNSAGALPILAVTANAYSEDIKRCEDAGMQAHLSKPLRLTELSAAILEWSDASKAEVPLTEQEFEEETDPRLLSLFADRMGAASAVIDEIIARGHAGVREKQEVIGLLHQIVGVAAYFGRQTLGETCRKCKQELAATEDDAAIMALLKAIRADLERAESSFSPRQ